MLTTLSLGLLLAGQSTAGDAPVRATGAVRQPQRLKSVAPVYPEEARRAGLAEDVVLECTLDPQGRVSNVKLVRGVSPLMEAAIDAAMQWRYEPTLVEGVAVPVVMTVTVHFTMHQVKYNELMGSLDSRNEHIRESAARNLGGLRLGNGIHKGDLKKAARELEKLAEKDESARVRAAAARAAARLEGRPLPADSTPGETASSSPEASDGTGPPTSDPARESNQAAEEVQGHDQPPKPIDMPRPSYPYAAFQKRIEGTVLLEILIDTQGRVAKARVIQSVSGLDEAALDCVTRWRFSPALKNGKPVGVIAHVPVSFRISDDKK